MIFFQLSLGGGAETASDSSGDEDDLVLVNVFLGNNLLKNLNHNFARVSPSKTTAQTSSFQDPFPGEIRGTEPDLDDPQSWIYFPTGIINSMIVTGCYVLFTLNHLGRSVTQLQSEVSGIGDRVGITTCVNGRDVTLYHTQEKVYCSDQKCPHAGGLIDVVISN